MKTENQIEIANIEELRARILSKRSLDQPEIIIAGGTCGYASGAQEIIDAFREELKKHNLDEEVEIKITGCHGFCAIEPAIIINPGNILYMDVLPKDVGEIVSETIINKKVIERLLYTIQDTGEKILHEEDIPFYKKQIRRLLANNTRINPLSIEDYIAVGGYSALEKSIKIGADKILGELKASGLRGRGGAGFPTVLKWDMTKKAQGSEKYIVCNADEGDPGAFMDRSLLEGTPHSVIEGMIIGGYTIGSNLGFVYIRKEYPMAILHLHKALEQAREYGFLGDNILGTDFSFDIEVVRGAGAFICGEETNLLKSIEGAIVEARTKPPFPALKGLWESPTVLNNVKTLASIPLIISNGADWYSNVGTEMGKGTIIFAIVGKIKNTGLIEVPMGMTLREIIYDIGGGIAKGKKFKAVQTGGPSGGCLPESLLDMPVDYESLTKAGTIMGSGGMIVMDENTCMVEIARYFLSFTQDESCGKCAPCREGTKHMLDILTRITQGEGHEEDIAVLENMGELIIDLSLCGLGKTAPKPALSTIKYFRDEYEAHIKDKKCPAKVCKALIKFSILEDKCTGCHLCFRNCPTQAIVGEAKKSHSIIQDKCVKCGMCSESCRFDAVRID
jgi:NADH:ubiquinone oxidoreductase subunit F (NADH-binding)/(2Fe-2S) ferredoxin/NAD-dependent dihydropyrimidine dehydrogenase PreA subunit